MFSNVKSDRQIAISGKKNIYLHEDSPPNEYKSTSKIEVMPNIKKREVVYVTGSSGAGKSTWCSEYVKKFLSAGKDREAYLFSQKESDPVFDSIKKLMRLKIDDRLIKDPLDPLKEFPKNSLVIFDDIESLSNPYKDIIMKLILLIMEVGRSYGIWILITSHLINNSNRHFTRSVLNEAHIVVFFKNNNVYGTKYYLKNYGGYDNKQIDAILKTNTRSFSNFKNYPGFFVTDYLIKQF
jgi:ABC-type phosphate/phosphonate transport system ATPase subunit